jgi:hypothetical protein
MGVFETRDENDDPLLRPLRVAVRREEVYAEAKTMAEDLPTWRVVSADETTGTLQCERVGGLLGKGAKITVVVEGPDGLPSATVHVRSETAGGWFARDKANVREFMEPFSRRIG